MKKYIPHPSMLSEEELRKADPLAMIRAKWTWEGADPREHVSCSCSVENYLNGKALESIQHASAQIEAINALPEIEKLKLDLEEYYKEHHALLEKISKVRRLLWDERDGLSSDTIHRFLELPTEKFVTPKSDFARELGEARMEERFKKKRKK